MAPTKPNADVTVMYRHLNSAKVRWGLSSGHNHYIIKITQGGVFVGQWALLTSIEVGDHCEFDLDELYTASPSFEPQYSTTYELQAFGYNSNTSEWSIGTTPATLTTAPQYPSFDFSQSGTTVTATLQSSFNLNWTYVVCGIYKDNVLQGSFTITNPSRSYGITGLSDNTGYQLRSHTVYNVNGTLLTSVDYDGNLGINSKSFFFQGPRPNNFTWDNPKVSEGTYNLTAIEWNNYLSRFEQFIIYTGGTNFIPVYVAQNDTFYASYMNKVIQFLVLYLHDKTDFSILDYVYQDSTVTATLLNRIVTEMNKF